MQPGLGRIVYVASDFLYLIQFRFFQRRHGSYCSKPTQTQSGWPGEGMAKCIRSGNKLVCRNHLVWKQAGVQESSGVETSWCAGIIWCGNKLVCRNHLVWKQAGVLESSGLETSWCAGIIWTGNKLVCRNHLAQFLTQCNWPITNFPLLESVAFFHKHPGSHSAKSTWIQFISGYVRFWPNRSGVQESSGLLLANASKPIRIRYKLDLICLLGKLFPLLKV